MADDDIYNNKRRFESFVKNLPDLLKKPGKQNRKRKYWIKCKDNLKYYKKLFKVFEAKDNSYIRRLRLCRTFLLVCYTFDEDISKCGRDDIDDLMAFTNGVNKTISSRRDFIIDLKYIWKILLPEKDRRGRIDDTVVPYPVRHLNNKIDKSKEKMREDKFSLDEFEKLVIAFSSDPRMQCLLTLSLESLGRPQEILQRKIKDVEIFENYAKIYISDHGKEGIGFLKVMDSFFYLTKWLNSHPLKNNPDAYLFVNTGPYNRHKQMKPFAINKAIRRKCKLIGLNKPITLYSLKRNGITMMRLAGASDMEIQHTARWTSTKQLKTYDLSNQEDSFKRELMKRGIIKDDGRLKGVVQKIKICAFCGESHGIVESICKKCNRPLDRTAIRKKVEEQENKMKKFEDMYSKMEKFLVHKQVKEEEDSIS